MPRNTRSRQRIIQQSDSSEDENQESMQVDSTFNPLAHSSMAVPHSSSTTQIAQVVETSNHDTMVTNLVKLFLNYSSTKLPIKRADITKHVHITAKNFSQVLSDAKLKLEIIYGLEVEELTTKSGKVYILYSKVKTNFKSLLFTPDQRSELGFLFLILSFIFMKNGEVTESKLIKSIKWIKWFKNISLNPHYSFSQSVQVPVWTAYRWPRNSSSVRRCWQADPRNFPPSTLSETQQSRNWGIEQCHLQLVLGSSCQSWIRLEVSPEKCRWTFGKITGSLRQSVQSSLRRTAGIRDSGCNRSWWLKNIGRKLDLTEIRTRSRKFKSLL